MSRLLLLCVVIVLVVVVVVLVGVVFYRESQYVGSRIIERFPTLDGIKIQTTSGLFVLHSPTRHLFVCLLFICLFVSTGTCRSVIAFLLHGCFLRTFVPRPVSSFWLLCRRVYTRRVGDTFRTLSWFSHHVLFAVLS